MNKFFLLFCIFLASPAARAASNVLIWTLNEVASPLPTAVVEINGRRAGVSDSLGRFYAELQPGKYSVSAYIPGFQRGTTTFEFSDLPVTQYVEVLLNEPDVSAVISGMGVNDVLPEKITEFTVELRDRTERPLPIQAVESIYIIDTEKNVRHDVRDYFILSDGKISVDESALISLRRILEGVRSLLKFSIRTKVDGFSPAIIEVERNFYVGRYTLLGKIVSTRGAVLNESIALRLDYRAVTMPTSLPVETYAIRTNADGSFRLENMPFGYYQVRRAQGTFHENSLWDWNIQLFGDTQCSLHPLDRNGFRSEQASVRYQKAERDPRFIVRNEFR